MIFSMLVQHFSTKSFMWPHSWTRRECNFCVNAQTKCCGHI